MPEREREGERQTDRQRQRERERQRQTERDTERDRDRQRETERERQRQTERDREKGGGGWRRGKGHFVVNDSTPASANEQRVLPSPTMDKEQLLRIIEERSRAAKLDVMAIDDQVKFKVCP